MFNVIANKFTKTINLDYNDCYNITISKRRSFYTTITVNGKVSIYPNQILWHDNWVLEPYPQQEACPEQEPSVVNESYTAEQAVRVFSTSDLVVPAVIVVKSIIIFSYGHHPFSKKKHSER